MTKQYPVSIRNERNEIIGLETLSGPRLSETRYVTVEQNQKMLYTIDFKDGPYIMVPADMGIVDVVFRNEQKAPLESFTMDLRKHLKKKTESQRAAEQYRYIRSVVSEAMDEPQGTEKERSEHTRLLRDATSSKKAETYVKSRITNIILNNFNLKQDRREEIIYRLFADLYGLGVLQELDDDPEMGEIMVNAVEFPEFYCDIYYIKNGVKYKYDKTFNNIEELQRAFNNTIRFEGLEMNKYENPRIEANRPNGDRVNIIIPDASDNWLLNIRKFTNFTPNLESMKRAGTVDDTSHELFDVLVRGKANIGIGGEMGTGKTTLINYLLTYTKPIERKVVIASVSEMDTNRVLKGHDVAIFNVNEKRNLGFDDLLQTSLRTTADRVIIPESRGGEFKELYEANLKTKGNMFTAHAMDDSAFMDVVVDMYLSSDDINASESTEFIRDKITKAIDIVVIMGRVGSSIRIKSISEVLQTEDGRYGGMNRLYEFVTDPEDPTVGRYERTGNRLSEGIKDRLNSYGIKRSELEKF